MIGWAFKPIYIHFLIGNQNLCGSNHMVLKFTDIFILLLKQSTLTNAKKCLRFKYQVKIIIWFEDTCSIDANLGDTIGSHGECVCAVVPTPC